MEQRDSLPQTDQLFTFYTGIELPNSVKLLLKDDSDLSGPLPLPIDFVHFEMIQRESDRP